MGGTDPIATLDFLIQEYTVKLYLKRQLREKFSELTKELDQLEDQLKTTCPHSECKSRTQYGSCAYDRTETTYTCEKCKLTFREKPKGMIRIVEETID